MKKIKRIKYKVELSYRHTFIFNTIGEAGTFMKMAVEHAEDPEDIERFEIETIVEYKEEFEPIYCDTDRITEADKEEENKGGDNDV